MAVAVGPAVDTALAVARPATSAVKRQIQNKRDEKCMRQLLEAAMRQASSELVSQQNPLDEDVAKVARGAVSIGKTGQVEPPGRRKRLWQGRPEFIGGYRRHRLQAVGSLAAIDELTGWIQRSAAENHVTSMQGEAFARRAARDFLDYVCHYPNDFSKTADFCERLADAWVIQDDKARARHNIVTPFELPTVLTGAAAAVAAIVGWTAFEVLRLAGTVGILTVAVAVGILLYRRQRDAETSAHTPAQFIELRSLLEQIAAFVIDLRQMSVDATGQTAAGEDSPLQDRLSVLMKDLEQRLLPKAQAHAHVLASHLQRVYDQMLLLQQKRASFDSLNLHAANLDLWKALEGIGRKRRIEVPGVPIPATLDGGGAETAAAASPSAEPVKVEEPEPSKSLPEPGDSK
jgi:hypothetical protein